MIDHYEIASLVDWDIMLFLDSKLKYIYCFWNTLWLLKHCHVSKTYCTHFNSFKKVKRGPKLHRKRIQRKYFMILLRGAHFIHSMFENFIFEKLRKTGLWIPMIRADSSAAKKPDNSVRVMGPRIYGVTEDVIRKLNNLRCLIVMNSERGSKFATHYWH